METPGLGLRIAAGVLAAVCVPFAVTGMYRVLPIEMPFALWALLPFALLALLAVWVWRSTRWKSVAVGILSGLVVYGVALTVVVYEFSSAPF